MRTIIQYLLGFQVDAVNVGQVISSPFTIHFDEIDFNASSSSTFKANNTVGTDLNCSCTASHIKAKSDIKCVVRFGEKLVRYRYIS